MRPSFARSYKFFWHKKGFYVNVSNQSLISRYRKKNFQRKGINGINSHCYFVRFFILRIKVHNLFDQSKKCLMTFIVKLEKKKIVSRDSSVLSFNAFKRDYNKSIVIMIFQTLVCLVSVILDKKHKKRIFIYFSCLYISKLTKWLL